jgi:hypothetical protein
MTTIPPTSAPPPRGVVLMLHGRCDVFRVLWTQLAPDVRWRLTALVRGELEEITLSMLVREVQRTTKEQTS